MTKPGENNGDAENNGDSGGFPSSYSQYGQSSGSDAGASPGVQGESFASPLSGSEPYGAGPSGPAPYDFPAYGAGPESSYDSYAAGSGYGNPVPPGVAQDPYYGDPNAGFQPGFQPGYAPGPAPYGQYPGPGAPLVPAYGGVPMGYQPKSYAGAALLAFFLGGLGVHNFYLGYTGRGIAQLIICVFGWLTTPLFGFGLLLLVPLWIWTFVEFILILCRSGSYGHDSNGVPLV